MINPQLAFGHRSSYGFLVWVFVVLFAVGLLDLICALWWSARSRSSARLAAEEPVTLPAMAAPEAVRTPSDEGVRVEQLKIPCCSA